MLIACRLVLRRMSASEHAPAFHVQHLVAMLVEHFPQVARHAHGPSGRKLRDAHAGQRQQTHQDRKTCNGKCEDIERCGDSERPFKNSERDCFDAGLINGLGRRDTRLRLKIGHKVCYVSRRQAYAKVLRCNLWVEGGKNCF